MIPYGRQHIAQDDVDAVEAVLRSDFLTQGPAVPAFEKAVAEHVGANYGVAVNSATSALHVACLALGLGPGDVLWTVPITFLASANCARYCGADVDFVDIDPVTRNMSVQSLADKLRSAAETGRLPKIVVPVHFTGLPCDMEAIRALCLRYGCFVVEDASHAVGARLGDSTIGDCAHSDITVFSFHPVKIVTSAEGGMAMTNDGELARRMQLLRSHGMERDPSRFSEAPEGDWIYEMQSLGFNYRLTDMQAALGLSQMRRIETFIEARVALAARYDELLADLPVIRPAPLRDKKSSWHLYVIEIDTPRRTRAEVFAAMRALGVGVAVHYIPVHLQPYYRALGFKSGDFPVSERYYRRALSLPMFPALSERELNDVVFAFRQVLA
ncbi:MAG: UDP-4-amino-4,6-dideoxy-N-acetyl-beta-L-altrosamine transaminase [Caldimonas sp.]